MKSILTFFFSILLMLEISIGNTFYSNPDLEPISAGNISHLEKLAELDTGFNSLARSLEFDPKDNYLLVRNRAESIFEIWNLPEQTPRLSLDTEAEGIIREVIFSPDSTLIVIREDNRIKIWDLASGTEFALINGERSNIEAFAFSPNGEVIAFTATSLDDLTATQDYISLWDIKSRKEKTRIEYPLATSLAFSSDGRFLVSASANGKVGYWDLFSTNLDFRIIREGDGHFVDIAVSKNDTLTYQSYYENIRLAFWNIPNNEPVNLNVVYEYAFPLRTYGKVMMSRFAETASFQLWDIVTGEDLATVTNTLEGIQGISVDESIFIMYDESGILLRDVKTGEVLYKINDNGCCAIFSSTSKYLIVWENNSTAIQIWGIRESN